MRLLRIPSQLHAGKVTALSLDTEQGVLASAGDDGVVALWDVQTLLQITALEAPSSNDIKRLKPFSIFPALDSGVPISCLKLCSDVVVSVDLRGNVYKGNVSSLEQAKLFTSDTEINDLVFFDDLVLFGTLNKILVYDLKTSTLLSQPILMRTDIRALAIDPTSTYLATIGLNKSVNVLQVQFTDGELLSKNVPLFVPLVSSLNATCNLSWSPTGEYFAVPNLSVDNDTNCIGMITRSGWKTEFSLVGHNANIVDIVPSVFTNNNSQKFNIVASSGVDKSIAVWNTSFQRPLFTASDVSETPINQLQWSKNGEGLFAASDSILIFAFEPGELGKPISGEELSLLRSHLSKPEPIKPKVKADTKQENGKEKLNSTRSPTQVDKSTSTSSTFGEDNGSKSVINESNTIGSDAPTQEESRAKDGKRRIAPLLISAFKSDNIQSTGTTASSAKSTHSGNANATTEFDSPSYLVPKSIKRKEEFDNDQPKKKRGTDVVEFIGSVVINPSTSFSKVRISTPKITSSFLLQSSNDESLSLEIKNGSGNEQKPSKITLLKNGTKQIFVDFIPKLLCLATGGEGDFWAVSTATGVLYVYSDTGRKIFPPIILGTPLSFLESKNQYLLAVTSIGEVYAWDVVAKKAIFEPTSLYPLLSRSNPDLLTRAENLTLCAITTSGVPIITLSNGNGYLYDKDMETWSLVSDSWWAFGSQYWDSIDEKNNGAIINLLERKTNDEIVRRGRSKFLQKMAKTMLMKEGYENLEKTISLAHLENRLLISWKLGEDTEFKTFLIIYCKRISEMGYKAKLSEILEDLMGPNTQEGNDVKWDSKVLSFDKHELLKEIIFSCANIRTVQRILVQYATELNILDKISFF